MPAREDWRDWLLSATARAAVATGFLLTPTVREQLGDAAVASLALFLAVGLFIAGAGHWYLARGRARRDLTADAFAMVALVPAATVASEIQGADDRFGGRTTNVLAALAATTMIFAIVALIARMDGRVDFGAAAAGSVAGALTVAALVGNPARFTAVDAWQMLSVAWMVAALTSALFIFLPDGARSVAPPGLYGLFALVVILLPSGRAAGETSTDTLAILTLVVVGAIMVLVAPSARRT